MKKIIYYVFSLLDSKGMKEKTINVSKLSKIEKDKLLEKKIKWSIGVIIVGIILSFCNVFYNHSNIIQILIYVIGIIGFVLLYQIYIITDINKKMIKAILINPNEAKISLIEIENNSILAIAKVICENPKDISLNPYYAVGQADDIIHTNHGLNRNENDDYFTMIDAYGNSQTIYGNAVIVGALIVDAENNDGLALVYTDTTLSIADLMGNIDFFANN